MTHPGHRKSSLLDSPDFVHGFFSREGGVSNGFYASLNTGVGSNDDAEHVTENRRRCAVMLGVRPERLLTNYQVHSADVLTVNGPFKGDPIPADGLVTSTSGLAIGVLAADCMPWLFADPEAGVIGAAHGGWRGAIAGVLENTITAMEELGAERSSIKAALGPCLRQKNFEVGLDLLAAFTEKYPNAERFFAPGRTADKRQLDLAGFGAARLRAAGVEQIDDLDICTLANPDRYFSYRASRRRGEKDYGRNLSAIALV